MVAVAAAAAAAAAAATTGAGAGAGAPPVPSARPAAPSFSSGGTSEANILRGLMPHVHRLATLAYPTEDISQGRAWQISFPTLYDPV
jgi:hypothetical protein